MNSKNFNKIPSVLTIAGSDCGGGAGIQADLKTFTSLNVYGMSVITAITAQNTIGVQGISISDTNIVEQQLQSIFSDIPPKGIKTGMIPTYEMIEIISGYVKQYKTKNKDVPFILDPVLVATSGDKLVSSSVINGMIEKLFPLSTLITPNLQEAQVICDDMEIITLDDLRTACKIMVHKLGCNAVLIKGGHNIEYNDSIAADILYDGHGFNAFTASMIDTKNTHGTGCTLASAIASFMVKGMNLKESIENAKGYVRVGLKKGIHLGIGSGNGPLYHMHTIKDFEISRESDDDWAINEESGVWKGLAEEQN